MLRPWRFSLFTMFALTWSLMAVALLSGCVTQSIQPVYDDDTLLFDERLLGSWTDDEAVWTFTAERASGYRLEHRDPDVAINASAHLARLPGGTFLDIRIEEDPEDIGDLREVLVLPLHTVFRVDEIGDRLVTSSLSWKWLADYLEDHPDEIAHTVVDDRVVFTDTTAALQRFLTVHASDEDAWEQAVVMRRRATAF